MELMRAESIAEDIGFRLHPFCERVRVAGSIRRKKPDVGDIEIVCIPRTVLVADGMFDKKEVRVPGFAKTFAGMAIVKGNLDVGKYIQLLQPEGIKVDVFTATKNNWGFIYAVRTGSADFSKSLARRWVSRGYKGIGGNLCRDGIPVPTPTEKSFFDLLGLDVIHPTKRNQGGLPQ